MPKAAELAGGPSFFGDEYAIFRTVAHARWRKGRFFPVAGGEIGLIVTNRRIAVPTPPEAEDFFATLVDETQMAFLHSLMPYPFAVGQTAKAVLSIPLPAVRSVEVARTAWHVLTVNRISLRFEVPGGIKRIAFSWPAALGRDFARSTGRRFLDACVVAGAAIKSTDGRHYAIAWR
jgi:hypothetical protein